MKAGNLKYLIAFLFLLYFFVVFEPAFHGPDEPLYLAYTCSVVEDADLNIVNNIDPAHTFFFPSGKIGISKTHNLPDYHNHGGAVFWVPAYLYGKFSYFLWETINTQAVGKYSLSDFITCALSFSTVFFVLLSLLLSYFFCRRFFSPTVSFWSVLAVFFGTPFFRYTLFETGNANAIASLLSVALIWFGSYMVSMKKTDFLFFGLFFSMCIIIKSELAFQAVFILLVFVSLLVSKKIKLISSAYFIAGFIPGFILRSVNDFIKYGSLRISEISSFNIKNCYFFEQLFSSYRGFVYTSPVLLISLLGLFFAFKHILSSRARQGEGVLADKFLVILGSCIVIKLLVLSFRFAWGGGTAGARILFSEFLIFILLFARTFQIKKYLHPIFIFCSVIFVAWNFIIIHEYSIGVDMQYALHPPGLSVRIQELINALRDLLSVRDLGVKLKIGLPLLFLTAGTIFFTLRDIKSPSINLWYTKKERPRKLFFFLIASSTYFLIVYTAFTILNISNNQNNVLKLKKDGFFNNAVLLSEREFEKEENFGSMNEMIEYFQAKGDLRRVRQIKIQQNQLYGGFDHVR